MVSTTSVLVALLLLGCSVCYARAAICITNSNNTNFILTSDIVTNINNIATNHVNPPLSNPLTIQTSQMKRIAFPTTTFCIESDNAPYTHLKISAVTAGANEIVSQCCPGVTCQGGLATIIGIPLGVKLILAIQPGGTTCQL